MKQLSKILTELEQGKISSDHAEQLVLDLFTVSKAKLTACRNCGKELKYSENGVTQYHCSCGAVDPAELD